MSERFIDFLVALFRLVEGHLTENICKVFTVANIAGFMFCAACLEGPYTGRAAFAGIICLLLACFFGTLMMMYREVEEWEFEEDNLYL